ncbi:hypothetical protein HUJ04_009828 [Dendroctonus ponderosae]|nr:hypothetical protein HUJ04_009828 [Dendroctonus ponderosae]
MNFLVGKQPTANSRCYTEHHLAAVKSDQADATFRVHEAEASYRPESPFQFKSLRRALTSRRIWLQTTGRGFSDLNSLGFPLRRVYSCIRKPKWQDFIIPPRWRRLHPVASRLPTMKAPKKSRFSTRNEASYRPESPFQFKSLRRALTSRRIWLQTTGRGFSDLNSLGFPLRRVYSCIRKPKWQDFIIPPRWLGTQWKIVTAFLLLCGLFICFSGHRFFKTGLFIIAYTFGAVFMLTAISILTQFGGKGKEIFSFISVLAFALLWLFLWRKFGIPVVAVQLAFLLSGLLVASILFYSQLGDIYIFANDATFWTCFVCLLIVTQKPFGCLTSLFYIIALSLVGSYAVIFAVNYYVGGNLPYILLNTYRRITVANFGSAVIAPPYQTMDICQTGLWVLIFCIGVYIQTRSSMGRPPFPPRRAYRARARVDENTPLIEPNQEMPPAYFEAVYS